MYKVESRSQSILSNILKLFSKRDIDMDWHRGYISGMFDAEGNMSKYRNSHSDHKGNIRTNPIRISQYETVNPHKVAHISHSLTSLGIPFNYKGYNFTIHGGMIEKIRFFSMTSPAVSRKSIMTGIKCQTARSLIHGIRYVGDRKLIDIQTSSGTFIANGFIVHNCYMMRDQERYGLDGTKLRKAKTTFNFPLKYKETKSSVWKGAPLIFMASLSDIFHKDADQYRNEIWDMVRKCPHLIFQILTKRPERIKDHLPPDWGEGWDNVWLGTSCGSQESDQRAAILLSIKAKIRFLSLEPLHDKFDLENIRGINSKGEIICKYQILKPISNAGDSSRPAIDWVIIGGESGNNVGKYRYRECKLEWIEKIVDQCKAANVPVFVKQLGTHLAKEMKLKDRHGGDILEFPEHLQIRQFPIQIKS